MAKSKWKENLEKGRDRRPDAVVRRHGAARERCEVVAARRDSSGGFNALPRIDGDG